MAVLLAVMILAAALRIGETGLGNHNLSADEVAYGRLALNIANRGHYGDPEMKEATRWAPGGPVAFALAHRLLPGAAPQRAYEVPEARRLNVILGVLTVLCAFAAVAMLTNPWLGLAAATAIALHPGLVVVTRFQLTEPLGGFLLAAAVLALIIATRHWQPRWLFGTGLLLGAAVLVRADLLLIPLIVATVVAWARRASGRVPSLSAAGMVLAGAMLIISPWVIYNSVGQGHLVPVSDGGPGTLFIGTYLPGHGKLTEFKHKIVPMARAENPALRNVPAKKINAAILLSSVARRQGGRERNAALMAAALENIRVYGLGQPLAFIAMDLNKGIRMWDRPFRARSQIDRYGHLLLLALALAGSILGLYRRRDPVMLAILGIIAYSTFDNMVMVAEPRHNLPLIPIVAIVGAIGWGRWINRRKRATNASSAVVDHADVQTRQPAAFTAS